MYLSAHCNFRYKSFLQWIPSCFSLYSYCERVVPIGFNLSNLDTCLQFILLKYIQICLKSRPWATIMCVAKITQSSLNSSHW